MLPTIKYLIKFGSHENMVSLLDGKVYLKNLAYFINREQEDENQIVGDALEGKCQILDVKISISDPNTNEKITQLSSKRLVFDYRMGKYPVYCTFLFDERNRLQGERENAELDGKQRIIARYGFSESQKKEMATFGDSAVLIKNVSEFINRIKKAAAMQGIEVVYGAVSYYKDNELEHLKQVMENPSAVVFWKRKRYENQKEFRFLLNKEIENHMVLDIGDIRDIAALLPSEVLLNGNINVVISQSSDDDI